MNGRQISAGLTNLALQTLKIGNATNIAETLTQPLYDRVTLADGATSEFHPFAQSRAERNASLAESNVQIGNRVPAKQAWIVDEIEIQVVSPTALANTAIATLGEYLANTSVKVEIDSYTKLETTLGQILGAATLVPSVGTDGSNNLNATYTGKFKLGSNPFLMGAETNFNWTLENKLQSTVPTVLDGVTIDIIMKRPKFMRLVA